MTELTSVFRRCDLLTGAVWDEPVPVGFVPDYLGGVGPQINRIRKNAVARERRAAKAEPVSVPMVFVPPRPTAPAGSYSLKEILWCVSSALGISLTALRSPRRERELVDARFIYYVTAKNYTIASLVVIGRECGGRDHTTVMNGLEKVARHRAEYQERIEQVEAKLFERELTGQLVAAE